MKLTNRTLSWLMPILIIIPFFWISLYNHPALDDWWYAEVFKQHGFIGAQQYWYNNYTARFFSNVVMTLSPLSFSYFIGSKIVPIFFIACLFFTFYFIVKTLRLTFVRQPFVASLWLCIIYLLIQRDYFESIYWMSATVVYQFTFLYWLLHITILYSVFLEKKISKLKSFVLLITAFAITGSNEILGGLLLLETSWLLIYCWKNKFIRTHTALQIILLAVCWIFMFLAKGNWSKISDATQEHVYTFDLLKSLYHSFISVAYYSFFLLKQPVLYATSFFLFIIIKKKNKIYLLITSISFLIAGIIYFISIYPTGILIPPLRVTNIAIPFVFIGLLSLLQIVFSFLLKANFTLTKIHKTFIIFLAVLFTIVINTPYQKLLIDLKSSAAKHYNIEMKQRYKIIKSSETDSINLPILKNIPRTIIATDVTGPVFENIPLIFNKKAKAKKVE